MRRALAFLTPFGGAVAPSPAALAWFPPVGAVIGLGVGGIWWLAARAWPATAAAGASWEVSPGAGDSMGSRDSTGPVVALDERGATRSS